MKMLTFSVLLCATMALSTAAAPSVVMDPHGSGAVNESEDQHVVKRSSDSSWTEFNSRSFKYFQQDLTWVKAEKFCLSKGANLASVHSAEEYDWLKKKIVDEGYGKPKAWLGGSDGVQDWMWFWSDGTPFSYSSWCPGEPNNYGGVQHCLRMNYSARKCWDDTACDNKLPFVCVKKKC